MALIEIISNINRNLNKILLIAIAILFLCSCSSYQPAVTYRMRATLNIENNDYQGLNNEVEYLVKNYNCIIKSSVRNNSIDGSPIECGYTVLVNHNNYSEFLSSFKSEFQSDIAKESNNRESISEITTQAKIGRQKFLENRIRDLMNEYKSEKYDNNKELISLRIQNSIKELNTAMDDINSDFESMMYSVVEIKWHSRINDKPKIDFPVKRDSIIAGIAPIRDINLNDYGTVESFSPGEAVAVRINELKYQNGAITAKYDEAEGKIELELSEKLSDETIRLDTKCQKIDLGLGPIPKIIIGPDIDQEQVILTPRVDDNCNIIGFELRAGTIESGCTEGKANLTRLHNCIKYHSVTAPKIPKRKYKRTNKTKPTTFEEMFYYLPLN